MFIKIPKYPTLRKVKFTIKNIQLKKITNYGKRRKNVTRKKKKSQSKQTYNLHRC